MSDTNENEIILYHQKDGVAVITLNRPKAYNALSKALTAGIVKCFKQAEADDAVKVIVLTGNGKAFSAGVDLKEMANSTIGFNTDDGDQDDAVAELFKVQKKPLIGAVNGYCITGGMELALCCDLLYASEHAVFSDTHTKVGVVPGWGMTQRLPRLIGSGRAKEMSFSGRKIGAQTALEWGLVNRVFPADQLMPETLKLATEIARNNQHIVDTVKHLIDHGTNLPLDQALAYELVASRKHNDTMNVSGMSDKLKELQSNKSE